VLLRGPAASNFDVTLYRQARALKSAGAALCDIRYIIGEF